DERLQDRVARLCVLAAGGRAERARVAQLHRQRGAAARRHRAFHALAWAGGFIDAGRAGAALQARGARAMSPADLRAQCETALLSTNLRAFLAVIRAGEGTSDADGYRRHYGGRLFDGYADHPRVAIKAGRWTSTAAGAYQFLSRTWDEAAKALALPDFSPASQDLAAVFLIRRRGALVAAMQGRLDEAIAGCAKEWASLPGSPYGQPTRTLAQAHA